MLSADGSAFGTGSGLNAADADQCAHTRDQTSQETATRSGRHQRASEGIET